MFFELLNSSHECNVTRTQAKKEEEPFQSLRALPFYDADLENAPGKTHKSRKPRKQEKFCHTVVLPSSSPELPLFFRIPNKMTP